MDAVASASPPGRGRRAGRWWWPLAVVPLLPSLGVGFLLDDWVGLAMLLDGGWGAIGELLRPADGQFLRPVAWVLFHLELLAFGVRGVAFHAVHLALFVVGAWLTGKLAARIGGGGGGFGQVGAVAAALALLYPGRVETYAWMAGAFDLAALVVGLALLLAHLAWRERPGIGRPLLLAALAFVATLTKESAYAILPVVVAWELLPGLLPPAPRRRRWAAVAGVAAGFGLGAAFRLWALAGVGGYPETRWGDLGARLRELPETVLAATFTPVNPFYGAASTALRVATAAAFAGLLVVAVRRARRDPAARRLLVAGATLGLLGLLTALPYLRPDAPWAMSRYVTLFGAGLAVAASAAATGRSARSRIAVAAVGATWAAATLLNVLPWLEAARARDTILAAIEADIRAAGRHEVWIAGPINRLKGAHLLGGALQPALDVTFPDRAITGDSAFFQALQGRPVGPPPRRPGVARHLYRFDPDRGVVRLADPQSASTSSPSSEIPSKRNVER